MWLCTTQYIVFFPSFFYCIIIIVDTDMCTSISSNTFTNWNLMSFLLFARSTFNSTFGFCHIHYFFYYFVTVIFHFHLILFSPVFLYNIIHFLYRQHGLGIHSTQCTFLLIDASVTFSVCLFLFCCFHLKKALKFNRNIFQWQIYIRNIYFITNYEKNYRWHPWLAQWNSNRCFHVFSVLNSKILRRHHSPSMNLLIIITIWWIN